MKRVRIPICFAVLAWAANAQTFRPQIPKTWDPEALHRMELPLAGLGEPPTHVSAEYYDRMPVVPVYRTYPVYAPGREPAGYWEWLKTREPEIIHYDSAHLKTREDWIRAGELLFYNIPPGTESTERTKLYRNPEYFVKAGVPVAADGTVSVARYVIREKGKVEAGSTACGFCHTRVLPDGPSMPGAQMNVSVSRMNAAAALLSGRPAPVRDLEAAKADFLRFNSVPWVRNNPVDALRNLPAEELLRRYPGPLGQGMWSRNGSHFSPTHIPDLIGIQDIRYFDATATSRHDSIGDLMRYAAVVRGGKELFLYATFGRFGALSELPDPSTRHRDTDEMLYALALYIYSLRPPDNPNKPSALSTRGSRVFQREGCGGCHTPPLYTNNKLTIAGDYDPPVEDMKRYDVMPVRVGTDPTLALQTRKGTGYYKVPSLRGVWYRGPFEHNGSVMTLEEWFDPARLRPDYKPSGFAGFNGGTRAVPGHQFGLKLNADDKAALIAFLKTL